MNKLRTLKALALMEENPTLQTIEVESTLEGLQNFVGGLIEVGCYNSTLAKNNIKLVFNEEGKLLNLLPALLLVDENRGHFEVLDAVCGNILICGVDDNGESVSLTDEQIQIVYDTIKGYEHDHAKFQRSKDEKFLPYLICK